MRPRRLSPAMAVALLALFVALGGTAYAAIRVGSAQIVDNSVKSRDIRNNTIKSRDIRNNTIKSRDVRNGSLRARDFRAGDLPQGNKGDKGDKGAKGDPGATDVVVRTRTGTPIAQTHYVFVMECEAGERATGGGAGFLGNVGDEEIQQSYPREANGTRAEAGDTPTGWVAIIRNNSVTPLTPIGFLICARP